MPSIFEKKKCKHCGIEYPIDFYIATPNKFVEGSTSPVCVGCLKERMDFEDMNDVDALCRWAGIPFIPDEWIRIYRDNPGDVLQIYSDTIVNGEYKGIDWSTVNDFWMAENQKGTLFDNIEEVKREFVNRMKMKWQMGATYEEFVWLERYYKDMSKMQNLKNPAVKDILQKVCKIALQVDKLLKDPEWEIGDVKDMTSIYTNMLKTSGFLNDDVANNSTMSSVAQLYYLMEKRGWQPTFYDGKAKDYADMTIDDIKKTVKRLVLGNSGVSELLEAKLRSANLPGDELQLDDAEDVAMELEQMKAIKAERNKKNAETVNNKEMFSFGGDD